MARHELRIVQVPEGHLLLAYCVAGDWQMALEHDPVMGWALSEITREFISWHLRSPESDDEWSEA